LLRQPHVRLLEHADGTSTHDGGGLTQGGGLHPGPDEPTDTQLDSNVHPVGHAAASVAGMQLGAVPPQFQGYTQT
jgi:hypothetical protein